MAGLDGITSPVNGREVLPPSQTIDIAFTNITYSTSPSFISKKRKQILKGLSGEFRSGELTVIMGPSGAGKTSLLNVLSGFIKSGVDGSILANGTLIQRNTSLVKNHSAYILQDNYLDLVFTVNEIMRYAADLKLSSKTTDKTKNRLIEEILDSMAMQETGNTRCGNLSGGQKKRLNICLELISNPSILFLDEPTSGLDSSSSRLLISKLKGLSRSGRTVICTIHQPSAALFSQFDHLYLLSSGRTVYQGTSSNILPFLDSVALPCPVFHNPADYVMDVIVGEFGDFTDKLIAVNNKYNWRNDNPREKSDTDNEWNTINTNTGIRLDDPESRSELVKYIILVRRMLTKLHRDWMISYFRLLIHMMVGVSAGSLYYGLGNSGESVMSNLSYYFVSIVYVSLSCVLPACITFPTEMKVLKKEHFNNWYKFTTYFLALITVNIPVQMVFVVANLTVSYLMTYQVKEAFRLFLFFVPLFITAAISELIGLALGTAYSPVNGVFNGSTLVAALTLIGGFFVLLKHMSTPMYLLSYVGFFRYVFELIVVSQLGYSREKLDCPQTAFYCQFRDPKDIVNGLLGLSEDNTLLNFGILTLYTAIIAVISFTRVRYTLKIS